MPPPDGSALAWLARAKGSLALAQRSKAADIFFEDLCYLAQQAAEKAIKAVYLHKQEVFRYTHSIEELLPALTKEDMLFLMRLKRL